MEDEWEEESTLVVELSGVIDKDFLKHEQKECHVLGIDTERPLLQIGSYVFTGEFEDSLGTCILLEEKADPKKKSHVTSTSDSVKLDYLAHTRKKLIMQRAFLNEKKPQHSDTVGSSESKAEEAEDCDESPFSLESSWPLGFDSNIDVSGAPDPLGSAQQKKPRLTEHT